jgi:sec-independent protein translocase protein TatC
VSDRDRKEASFWDHLEELRWRLLRSVAYVAVAMIATWIWREDLLTILRYPAESGAEMAGIEEFTFRIFEAAGGIILMMQISLVAGLILASPLIFLEAWLFVEPALEPREKRYVIFMLPAATVLFLGGVAFCYWIAPRAFAFFFRFNVGLGAPPELTLKPYLYFLLRLLLVFGLSFEMPLVLMFLAAVGFVTQRGLIRLWRHALVTIFVVAAIATPTTDPATMTLLAGPMILLYILSVVLCGFVEKRERGLREPSGTADDSDPG